MKKANPCCSKAIAHISAIAISDALTSQVLKFLLFLSNWSLQKTLLPLCHFQAPYFPCGFREEEIALDLGVKWLRGDCDRGMSSYVPWQEPQTPPSSDSAPQRPQPPDWIFECWYELALPHLLCALLASSRFSWGNLSNLPFLGTYLYLEGYSKIGYASKCVCACDVIMPKYRRKLSLHHSKWDMLEMEQKWHFCLVNSWSVFLTCCAFGEAVISQNLLELAMWRVKNEKFCMKFCKITWYPRSVSQSCFQRWCPP